MTVTNTDSTPARINSQVTARLFIVTSLALREQRSQELTPGNLHMMAVCRPNAKVQLVVVNFGRSGMMGKKRRHENKISGG